MYIEDCGGWWLSGCCSSVPEHWLDLVPGDCRLFPFPLFLPQIFLYLFVAVWHCYMWHALEKIYRRQQSHDIFRYSCINVIITPTNFVQRLGCFDPHGLLCNAGEGRPRTVAVREGEEDVLWLNVQVHQCHGVDVLQTLQSRTTDIATLSLD